LIQNGVELEGDYNGDVGNFILDTEVVTVGTPSYQLVLAFDIIDVPSPTFREYQRYGKDGDRFNQERSRGRRRGGSNIKDSYIQRHKILRKIVEKISTPGLYVKPIVSANKAYNVWKGHWNNLPYKTDGLVFTPVLDRWYENVTFDEGDKKKYAHGEKMPILKWKPSEELTIDVAIGGPQDERGQTHTRFRTYLYDEDLYDEDASFVPPKNIADTVQSRHWSFRTDSNISRYGGSIDDDILDTDREDRIAIANDRMDESTEWLKNKSCSVQSCCCGEELPKANRKIAHCSKCGILGVADAETEFVCKSECCPDQSIFGVTDTDSTMNRCTVMVPNDFVELAKHGIVEVIPRFVNDGRNFELCFKRVRKDLQRANTFSVAKEILELNRHNVSLEDVTFKNSASIFEKNSEPISATNGFKNMYRLHFKIKGWLYKAFGGKSIIDACSGSLKDISNWKAAQFEKVVAIEKDPGECKRGRCVINNLKKSNNESNFISVQLIEGDLSSPMGRIIPDGIVDSIFCNFAIHYVWDKSEKTRFFFSNLIPHLKDGGMFVVTFMQGELLNNYDSDCIQICGDDGKLAFQANFSSPDKTVDVFIASVGRSHVESIMYLNEMKDIFKNKGLEFVDLFQFKDMGNLFHEVNLSSQEEEMSRLYAAAVFKKQDKNYLVQQQDVYLVNPVFPPLLERLFLVYLPISDLVRFRKISKLWKRTIDKVEILPNTKNAYFSQPNKIAQYDERSASYMMKDSSSPMNASALAQYYKFGGSTCEVVEDEEENDDDYTANGYYSDMTYGS
jgi:hypothetical protein